MSYGDYSGPDKADKGKEGGSCNRSLCQAPNAVWYNHGSYAWYCRSCMMQINDTWAQRHWVKDFPNVKHPQFETREMMNSRKEPNS